MKYACHFYSGIILLLIWIICVDFWFGQLSTKKTFTFSATFFQSLAGALYFLCFETPHPYTLHPKPIIWGGFYGVDFSADFRLFESPNYPR